MKPWRALAISLRSIGAHPVRTAIAVSGIGIGIGAVTVTTAITDGASAEVLKTMGPMGTRLLVIRPAQVQRTTARKAIQGVVSTLVPDDCAALDAVPGIDAIAPTVEGPAKVKTDRGVVATQVLGTTPSFFRARSFRTSAGRLFDDEEDRIGRRSVVLGGRIRRALFAKDDPVGQSVQIGPATFEVVGVLESRGAAADGSDTDNQVFVPIQTALRRMFNVHSLTRIFVSVRAPSDLDRVEGDVRRVLRERHGLERRGRVDDFAIQNQRRFLSARAQTARSLRQIRTGVELISLLVAGGGVLVLMLMSVRERTVEIGLRMAVGARPRDILLQFLTEALVLSLTGGLVGLCAADLILRLLGGAMPWAFRMSLHTGLESVALAVLVGLIFGVLPARQAARLAPVRALGLE